MEESIEKYLEYQYLVGLYTSLTQSSLAMAQAMKHNPHDLKAQGAMVKIEHDLKIIEPLVKDVSAKLSGKLLAKYAEGKTFKFIPTR